MESTLSPGEMGLGKIYRFYLKKLVDSPEKT